MWLHGILAFFLAAPAYQVARVNGGWRILDATGTPVTELLAAAEAPAGRFVVTLKAPPVRQSAGASACPDVFDPAWEEAFGRLVERSAREHRGASRLVGYRLPQLGPPKDAACWLRAGAEQFTRQQFVQMLKDKYGYNIGRVNELFSLDAGSFTELLTIDAGRFRFSSGDAALERDAFLSAVQEQVARVAASRLESADPGRLLFGSEKAAGVIPVYPPAPQVKPEGPFVLEVDSAASCAAAAGTGAAACIAAPE